MKLSHALIMISTLVAESKADEMSLLRDEIETALSSIELPVPSLYPPQHQGSRFLPTQEECHAKYLALHETAALKPSSEAYLANIESAATATFAPGDCDENYGTKTISCKVGGESYPGEAEFKEACEGIDNTAVVNFSFDFTCTIISGGVTVTALMDFPEGIECSTADCQSLAEDEVLTMRDVVIDAMESELEYTIGGYVSCSPGIRKPSTPGGVRSGAGEAATSLDAITAAVMALGGIVWSLMA